MLQRVAVIAFNTYREAARARILHGLFALALATAGYATIVGQYASTSAMRVISDLGAASISLYSVVVAIIVSATSLYREVELKTIFPVIARPVWRSEYLVGKFLGAWTTLAVFILINSAALLLGLALMSDVALTRVLFVALLPLALTIGLAWRYPRSRLYLPLLFALCVFPLAYSQAGSAADDRQVVVIAALLTLFEVAIITAVSLLFAAFSSPFLTAVFSLGVFLVGRSADTLANMPARVFGESVKRGGELLVWCVPNLMVYVPPRPLLMGQTVDVDLGPYLAQAAGQALAWCAVLLIVASLIFQRRDFV